MGMRNVGFKPCVRSGGSIVGVAAALLAVAPAHAATGAAPTARTDAGVVKGTIDGEATAFLGVPYAAPPVGPLRWRAPRSPAKWSGVRPADRSAASCEQAVNPAGFGPWTHEYVVQGPVSEDCLYLNVWAPRGRPKHAPVMVWLHGGGFNQGSGDIAAYNGAALARHGVIVVTVNYRLGVFGYFAHPELTREAAATGEPPGNYGLQDQIAALKWVRRNIAAFGGDPHRVTVAGQSAGALSVHALLSSSLARGLFNQAIAESGTPTLLPVMTLADAERAGAAFATAKGAASLEQLRALPPEKLSGAFFFPIADGVALPGTLPALEKAGHINPVPLLAGTNADEASTSSPPGYRSGEPGLLDREIDTIFAPSGDLFRPFYPRETLEERIASSRAAARDRSLASLFDWGRTWTGQSRAPLYLYLFDHIEPGPQAERYGVFHTSEVPYVFGTLNKAPERGFTPGDRRVSEVMMGYWLSFIRSGKPAAAGQPEWPRFDPAQRRMMRLDEHPRAEPVLPEDKVHAVDRWIADGGVPKLF